LQKRLVIVSLIRIKALQLLVIMKKNDINRTLYTAGGKIACARCTAKSKRTGNQCGKPSLKGKAVCQFHGGRSTGPKTEIGKARQRASVITSGNYTKESIEGRSRSALRLARLEDAMYVLEMTDAPRTRGRKLKGYRPLVTLEDVKSFVIDNPLNLPEGSAYHQN
jgi:hypothetical protein